MKHYLKVTKRRKAVAQEFWNITPPKAKKTLPITGTVSSTHTKRKTV